MNFGMIVLSQNIKAIKNCYMDIGSFIIHTKTEDFHKDIEDDVKNRYDTSNCEVDRPLPKEQMKKL